MPALAPTETQAEPTGEELIIGSQFTNDLEWLWRPADAEEEDRKIGSGEVLSRIRLYCFIGRRGLKTLGETFEQFCDRHNMTDETGRNHLKAVRATMEHLNLSDANLVSMLETGHCTLTLMTDRAASVLFRLRSSEDRASAVERYCALFTPPPILCSMRQEKTTPVLLGQLTEIVRHIANAKNPRVLGFQETSSTTTLPETPANPPAVVLPTTPRDLADHPYLTPPVPHAPTANERRPFVAPVVTEPTSTPEEVEEEAELFFPNQDAPDYIADEVEYNLAPAGFFLSFKAPNGATQTLFVRESQIVGAPTR